MKKFLSLLLCAALLLSMTAMAFADAGDDPAESPAPVESPEPGADPDADGSTAPGGDRTPGEDPDSDEPGADESGEDPTPGQDATESDESETPTDDGPETTDDMIPVAATRREVPYWDGAKKTTPENTDVVEVDEAVDSWGEKDADTWYVVPAGEFTIEERIEVTGHVHLILSNGCSLTAAKGIHVPQGSSLTIYGQSEKQGEYMENGVLIAAGDENQAGIGGDENEANGAITINGGVITAIGGDDSEAATGGTAAANGIGSGKKGSTGEPITVSGGAVFARAGNDTVPAIAPTPALDKYITHMTWAYADARDENGACVDWTPFPGSDWMSCSVEILPVTSISLSLTPMATTLNMGGEAKTVDFTAVLTGTAADGKTVSVRLPGNAVEWALENKVRADTDIDLNGKLTVAKNEPDGTTLYVRGTYRFDSNGDGTQESFSNTAPATVTVVQPEVTVFFMMDSTSGKVFKEVKVKMYQPVKEPAEKPKLDDLHVFAGWYTEDGKSYNFNDSVDRSPLYLYARWTDVVIYTIQLAANGGKCEISSMQTKANGTLNGKLPTPTKDGMYFAGWFTDPTDGVRVTETTVFTSNRTIYAHWSQTPVTGDENNITLWAALLGVSALAVIAGGVFVVRKGKKK